MTHRAAQAAADTAMAIVGIAILLTVTAVVTFVAVLIYWVLL